MKYLIITVKRVRILYAIKLHQTYKRNPWRKAKSRSKNDCKGRHYQCGCTKTYLSYPALYAHINTKSPDWTNEIQNKIKRGKPSQKFFTVTQESINLDDYIDELHLDQIFQHKKVQFRFRVRLRMFFPRLIIIIIIIIIFFSIMFRIRLRCTFKFRLTI